MIIHPYISSLILSLTWINSLSGSMFEFSMTMLKEMIVNYFVYFICIGLAIVILIFNNSVNYGVIIFLANLTISMSKSFAPIVRKSVVYLFITESIALLSNE